VISTVLVALSTGRIRMKEIASQDSGNPVTTLVLVLHGEQDARSR
jgi:hypothetical protein